jgi:hypothetical protein
VKIDVFEGAATFWLRDEANDVDRPIGPIDLNRWISEDDTPEQAMERIEEAFRTLLTRGRARSSPPTRTRRRACASLTSRTSSSGRRGERHHDTALDALDDAHRSGRQRDSDSGRAASRTDEEAMYLSLGGKRLYTPEARAARQVEIAEAIRAGDVREAVYHLDGRVTIEKPDGSFDYDPILANNREDQKAARVADSKARVSGWFT